MKVQKKLAEMSDATVHFLSLVPAGANAAPFKVMKADEVEGDTDVIQKNMFKTTPDQPQLIALVVSGEGNVEAATAIAKASGVEIQEEREVETDDGNITLLLTKKDDRVNTMDPAQVVVQLDENLGAVCRVEKSFQPFTGTTSFAEAFKSQGFFPQLRGALEVFGDVSFQIMSEATSPTTAAKDIEKATEELGTLLISMTKALPKETFKIDATICALKAEAVAEEPAADAEGTDAAAEDTAAEDAEAEVKKTADADAAAAATATAEAEAAAAAAAEGDDKGADDEPTLSTVLKALETLSGEIKTQGEATEELNGKVDAVAKKADEAVEAADEATTVTNRRVSRRSPGDPVQKDEVVSKGAPPLMDSAMDSRRRAAL